MSKLTELKQRPATIAISSRLDMRYLATLAKFWHGKGERVNSISELTRLSIETLSELLVVNHQVEFISTHSDAVATLERLGLISKDGSRTNPKNFQQALIKEDLNFNSLTTFQPLSPPSTPSTPKSTNTNNPELTIAQATLENMINEDLTTRANQAKERTKEFKTIISTQSNPASTPDDDLA